MPNDISEESRGRHYSIPDELRDEYAEELSLLSSRDFCISELLFGKERYPEAVYHLQQACEKLGKCIAVFYGILDTDEIRGDISHSLKKFAKKSRKDIIRALMEKNCLNFQR